MPSNTSVRRSATATKTKSSIPKAIQQYLANLFTRKNNINWNLGTLTILLFCSVIYMNSAVTLVDGRFIVEEVYLCETIRPAVRSHPMDPMENEPVADSLDLTIAAVIAAAMAVVTLGIPLFF
jgi:hypothetical protein